MISSVFFWWSELADAKAQCQWRERRRAVSKHQGVLSFYLSTTCGFYCIKWQAVDWRELDSDSMGSSYGNGIRMFILPSPLVIYKCVRVQIWEDYWWYFRHRSVSLVLLLTCSFYPRSLWELPFLCSHGGFINIHRQFYTVKTRKYSDSAFSSDSIDATSWFSLFFSLSGFEFFS